MESRGAGSGASGASAEPADSAWQTVLPLLGTRPVTLGAGQIVQTRMAVELPGGSSSTLRYRLEVAVR